MFARHGIPDQLLSDNGHTSFKKSLDLRTLLQAPVFPKQTARSSVLTVKNLLKKALDQYKVLMAYRATPLESGLSPAEL